jgi:MYXO-CTERM domain-containing protein
MRPKPALAILACAALGGLSILTLPANSQQAMQQGGEAPVQQARLTRSSLELGGYFDKQAKARFSQMLTAEERADLIELVSRNALPDAAFPLPTENPTQVFYAKFRSNMGRAAANRIKAAGGTFVGYAALNAHFIRARDAQSLAAIGAVLRSEPHCAGTLLREPADGCDARAYALRESADFEGGEFRVLFFRDVNPVQAAALLLAHNAPVLEASVGDNGELDLETAFIDTYLDAAALQTFVGHPLVEWVQPRPVWQHLNVDSADLSNATPAHIGPATAYNLDGSGIIVGVWDGGRARDTHQGFQSAQSPSPIGAGTKRILEVDGTSNSSHGTHVTGTIVSDGTGNSDGRGYAPEAFALSHDWNSMDSERRAARHNYRHVTDNHSYGNAGGGYGGYDSSAQMSDQDIRDLLLNMCKSAGNDGPGDNSLTDDACIKNSLTIAATSDTGTVADFSSRGPTDDGRLQPHFAANGVGLTSVSSSNDTDYVGGSTWSGTSMSSPSVCGSVALLAQLWKREMSNEPFATDVVRAILALTADDRGNTGPDYRYGFGIVDCQRAADLILSHSNASANLGHIVRGQIRQGETIEYNVSVSGTSPLRVVCSWLDAWASTGAGTKLVNDIDLTLVAPNGTTIHFPFSGLTASGSQTHVWTTTGHNRRDNIELATVNNPTAGTWKIRVNGFNIPPDPQASYPNDVTGFVLTCERPIQTSKILVHDTVNTGSPVAIPDNSQTGINRTFNIGDTRAITGVRLYCDISHTNRGHIRIRLTHPSNTTITLELNDTSTRDDIIGIFPDTRQYDDDVTALLTRPANGVWTVNIADVVSGGTGELVYLSLEVDVSNTGPANNPPVAEAGPNQNVNEGTAVALSASGSTDADSDPLTYQWSQTAGPAVTLSGAGTVSASFNAPSVASTTVLTFQVLVDDGNGGTDTDTVNVTVNDVPNAAPNADAGPDQSVNEGVVVNLTGAGSSDPESDPIMYAWTQISGPTVSLANPTTVAPSFTAPQVSAPTVLTFELQVSALGGQDTDTVSITVNDVPAPNNPPTANAGSDFSVTEGFLGSANGSASSDPDADPLSFTWAEIGTSLLSLSNANTATPSFTAPAVSSNTNVTLRLTVDDGRGGTDTDDVVVTILDSATGNNPPNADAGIDAYAAYGATVNLDGGASSDPENDTLTFNWAQINGATAITLNSPNTATPSFTAPSVDDVLVFMVTVDDGNGNQDTDTVTITVNATGTAPSGGGGSSGGGGKKSDGGGCSTDDSPWSPWALLAAVGLAAVALRSRRRAV